MQTRLLAVIACAACEHSAVVEQQTIQKRFPVDPDLDVLFVIDNSASTFDKQVLFAQNFPRLAQQLDAAPTGRPNLHLGVVSSTVGIAGPNFGASCAAPSDDGLLQNTPRVAGCSPPSGQFITDIKVADGTRTTNYSGSLADAFTCIAELGATGCGFEQQLAAMKLALDGSRAENAGFLRDDADLAVVILTDEDDCSVTDPALWSLNNVGPGDYRCQPLYAYDCDQPISAANAGDYTGCTPHHGGYLGDPAAYAQFLTSLKDPSQILVAVIAGDPSPAIHTGAIAQPFSQTLALEPSCTAQIAGNLAIARPALRLDEFRSAFGERGVFESVCQADYSAALAQIGGSMVEMMSSCLEGDIALAPRCTMTENGAPLAACAMEDAATPDPNGARPCFWIQSSASCTTGFAARVERAVPPPAGTVDAVTCAAAR